jgi:hypothetical protein
MVRIRARVKVSVRFRRDLGLRSRLENKDKD